MAFTTGGIWKHIIAFGEQRKLRNAGQVAGGDASDPNRLFGLLVYCGGPIFLIPAVIGDEANILKQVNIVNISGP
jgi:hypothetical protein